MIVLDVRDLTACSVASRGQLLSCSEAASTMLWKFHVAPRALGRWQRDGEAIDIEVLWDEPGRDVLETYTEERDATEYAAYAVAIALADHLGFTVLGRAHLGSGSDWLMYRRGEPRNDYYRMEVSGIARVNAEKPETRLSEKIVQLGLGDRIRPGVAVVTRFEDLRILSERWP